MINPHEIIETIRMIEAENLDIRTITMGISLKDCADSSGKKACKKIYDKITYYAKNLVQVGEDISLEYGIPIINKRISVTPISIVAESCDEENYVSFAHTLDRAAKEVGVNVFEELGRHNSSPALRRLGDTIYTGIQKTNVRDLRIIYVGGRKSV